MIGFLTADCDFQTSVYKEGETTAGFEQKQHDQNCISEKINLERDQRHKQSEEPPFIEKVSLLTLIPEHQDLLVGLTLGSCQGQRE